MRTKINKLKEALIANGEMLTFTESFNRINPEVAVHGFYKNELFGFDCKKDEITVWSVLKTEAKQNTINLLKEFDL
tara:strand:- start:8 stop:235 length:228 start_codon:yes stop_codon:yes gene_type:complete